MSSKPTPVGVVFVAAVLWLFAPLVEMNYFEPLERLEDEHADRAPRRRVSVTWLLRAIVVIVAAFFALSLLRQ